MRKLFDPLSLMWLAMACGLVAAPVVKAATSHASSINGGSACQLSIPTTVTGVRPKATGFRNESTTTGNFVICPISSGITPPGASTYTYLSMMVKSIDGDARDVTCTASIGETGYIGTTKYSSKTINIGDSGGFFQWSAADFGGVQGFTISGSAIASITCLLPPQMTILHTENTFDYDIGT